MIKRKQGVRRRGSGSMAVLDVGTSKIACFIAQMDSAGEVKITGIGHQLSKGVRCGSITDFAEAETSIVAAVHAAEQMAGETVENVVVNLSGGGLSSRNIMVEMGLLGEEVTDRDVLDIVEQGRATVTGSDAEIVHCIPVEYTLDGARGIVDPRQMFGKRLGADLHLIAAQSSVTRNLTHCIGRCHLNVEEYVASPYASGLSCLEEDEKQLGVTVVDMGGGVTGFSVFSGGRNIFTDVAPVGGLHVTSDVAKGLSTTLAHAERLKTLHGSAISSANDDQVMVDVPQLGEEEGEGNVLPRSTLVGIVRPRVEEIFEMIRAKIESNGLGQLAGRRVVLTGGASQLLGVREIASSILGKQVRLGRPRSLPGLAEAVSGPGFSTALGMIEYVLHRPAEEQLLVAGGRSVGAGGLWRRVTHWVKENF